MIVWDLRIAIRDRGDIQMLSLRSALYRVLESTFEWPLVVPKSLENIPLEAERELSQMSAIADYSLQEQRPTYAKVGAFLYCV
jgi:hypothetical protein